MNRISPPILPGLICVRKAFLADLSSLEGTYPGSGGYTSFTKNVQ